MLVDGFGWFSVYEGFHAPGQLDCSAIIPFEVRGEMSLITWYKVLDMQGKTNTEINSRYVIGITYFDEEIPS
jgi:hypothetical protein